MKNLLWASRAFVALLCLSLITSCQKESDSPASPQSPKKGLCTLDDVTTNSFITLAEELCGDPSTASGSFDGYMDCGLGTPGVGGSCCPPITRYLVFGGGTSTTQSLFEVWGLNKAGFTRNYLLDGVCTVAEQEDFLDRVVQASYSSAPVCNGGAYNPVAYTFEWAPFTDPMDAEIYVKVLYTSTCFGF